MDPRLERTRSLIDEAARLEKLGRLVEALAAEEEVVSHYRELANEQPAQFAIALARRLDSLAFCYSRLGRASDALVAAQDACDLYYRWIAVDSEASLKLANADCNVGAALHALGRAPDALHALRRAEAACRKPFVDDAGRRRILARTLRNLSATLLGVDRVKEAIVAAEEGAGLFRSLPDRDENAVACFANLASLLVRAARFPDAIAAASEAIERYRALNVDDATATYTDALAYCLALLGQAHRALGDNRSALPALSESVMLTRSLPRVARTQYPPNLAERIDELAICLSMCGRHEEAMMFAAEAIELFRAASTVDPTGSMHRLAQSLFNFAIFCADPVRAVSALRESVEVLRQLVVSEPQRYNGKLATSLRWLGAKLGPERPEEAIAVTCEAIVLMRAREDPGEKGPFAHALKDLARLYRQTGKGRQALTTARAAVARFGDFATQGNAAVAYAGLTPSLKVVTGVLRDGGRGRRALSLVREVAALLDRVAQSFPDALQLERAEVQFDVAFCLRDVGAISECVDAARRSLSLLRSLAAGNTTAAQSLAATLRLLCAALSDLGRHEEALAAVREAVDVYGRLCDVGFREFDADRAFSLQHVAHECNDLGRHEDALAACLEALQVFRRLVTVRDTRESRRDLAFTLGNLCLKFAHLNRQREGLVAGHEALELFRQLLDGTPAASRDLAMSLINCGKCEAELGEKEAALALFVEATVTLRGCTAKTPKTLHMLALSLGNTAAKLCDLQRRAEALEVQHEAVTIYRRIAADQVHAMAHDFMRSLRNLSESAGLLGQRERAELAAAELGQVLLKFPAEDPGRWADYASFVAAQVISAEHAHGYLLPLLESLAERRELAHNATHAARFLSLRREVAARLWTLLREYAATDPELVEDAIPALISALQSPDLARWLEHQDNASPLRQELAQAKRAVIAADQAYVALLARLSGGGPRDHDQPDGSRAGSAGGHAIADDDLNSVGAAVEALRRRYREVRARLVEADPDLRGAYEVVALPQLRATLEQVEARSDAALLCLLTLQWQGATRAVGVLLRAGVNAPALIEFPGLVELASSFAEYQPSGNRGRAPLRCHTSEPPTIKAETSVQGVLEQLGEQLAQQFWEPLHEAVAPRDMALHVCGHGPLHQLPMALLSASAEAGTARLVYWPGVPYLRLAALRRVAPGESDAGTPSGSWQIGHSCAWETAVPLPMAAVEAHLLATLLRERGHQTVQLVDATQLARGGRALVACCHGSPSAHLDSAIAFGAEPLTVGRIVESRLGPEAVLLPVCHAGETRDDDAGNALGVAAGFLLGGTRVVVASAKAVPDLLIPWFTTLLVWHVVHNGLGPFDAAIRARDEFAACAFPEAYRAWLQSALPEALATLQTGGSEAKGIERARRVRGVRSGSGDVLVAVTEHWPWQGLVGALFNDDTTARTRAVESAARNVLVPREDRAAEVRRQMREMAGFVFVYGVG